MIGCDLPTALQITRRLENEGFLFNDTVKAKLHKKKVYKVVKTDDTKKLMETEYFDPLKKISHHVSTNDYLSCEKFHQTNTKIEVRKSNIPKHYT